LRKHNSEMHSQNGGTSQISTVPERRIVMVAAGITVAGVLAGDLIMLYYRGRTMMNQRSY
jgi:hypothetical protein